MYVSTIARFSRVAILTQVAYMARPLCTIPTKNVRVLFSDLNVKRFGHSDEFSNSNSNSKSNSNSNPKF